MGRMKKLDGLRIVSLAPSVTSILLSLGVGRELVGVSRWCKDVAEVGSRPAVGDCWKMDVRELMRLRPTLLIGSVPFAPETVQKILAEPVAFLAINPRSLADIFGDVRTLGRLVDRRRAAGARLLRGLAEAADQFPSLGSGVGGDGWGRDGGGGWGASVGLGRGAGCAGFDCVGLGGHRCAGENF